MAGATVNLKVKKRDGKSYILSWTRGSSDFAPLMQQVDEGLALAYHENFDAEELSDIVTIRSADELEAAMCEFQRTQGPSKALRLKEIEDVHCDNSAHDRRAVMQLVRDYAALCANTARQIEPEITELVKDAATKLGGVMVGLDHRFKTRFSLERKLRAEVADVPLAAVPERMANKVKDALRYTIILKTESYTAGMVEILNYLDARQAGRSLSDGSMLHRDRVKNFWRAPPADSDAASAAAEGLMSVRHIRGGQVVVPSQRGNLFMRSRILRGDEYQGVNAVLRIVSPLPGAPVTRWELQFHTDESIDVKEVSHTIYERFRVEYGSAHADPLALHRMYYEMGEMWDQVPRPEAVETVGDGVSAESDAANAPMLPAIPEAKRREFEAMRDDLTSTLVRASDILRDWAMRSRDLSICVALARFLAAKHGVEVIERVLGKYQIRLRLSSIRDSSSPRLSLDDAAAALFDAVRFVVLLPPESYSAVCAAWIRDMLINGFPLERLSNEWAARRGVIVVFRVMPSGRLFTVAFHTADSYDLATLLERFGADADAAATAAQRDPPPGADTLSLATVGL
eukprot:c18786_g1_i3.p1 GENE.c18786_g1_i3~~c18786_g1_i3.p1  ORF type:complete len:571 (+),score=101.87 c18786_g1_i3:126-1838(+)